MLNQDFTFRTKVKTTKDGIAICHRNRVVMLGSCFTDNIGEKMTDGGFDCTVNPMGTLYNPASILQVLNPNIDRDALEWMHSRVVNPADAYNELQSRVSEADLIIVTFGTAYVYTLKSTGKIVANCRKNPENMFERHRLSADEIADKWIECIQRQKEKNGTQFIFTVSPIRHLKDGLHENQLSKATLLLAIEKICKACPESCSYFPSYEIMIDELRDYRFYNDDMMHPSDTAIEYIWSMFCQTYMDSGTIGFIEKFERLNRTLRHRPYNPDAPEYKRLITETNKQIQILKDAIQD